ncbi:MAG: arylsulfatase [Victivallaceae bacterium]
MNESNYNVLLLMTDQHRFDVLGCMGNPVVKTPNLDRIAAEGTVFENAYTACPSCIPARACLLTGMNQWHTGILGMGNMQPPMGTGFQHTLPGELADAGYHTQGIGKMHFFPQRSLNGFHHIVLDESRRYQDINFMSDYELWFNEHKDGDYGMSDGRDWNGWKGKPYDNPPELHPNIWTVDESIKFLNRRDPGKPFFLKVSFARPHSPYDAIPEYFDMYKDLALPEAQVGDWAYVHDDPEMAKRPSAWRGVKSKTEIHNARAGYYGNVTHIDHEIGRLLEKMEAQGVLQNTLIIFTSDHGDMLGDHNLWRKTYGYEGSTHVPMLVRLPEKLQNNVVPRSDKPVMLRDIMPTVLDILGLPVPETVDGLSMYPLTTGRNCEWREYAHGEHCTCYSEEQEMQYLTDGKIKYIWFPRPATEQLFDLERDPYELHNLSEMAEYSGILKTWRLKLVRELEKRDCGMTDGDTLVSQKGKPGIASPHFRERIRNHATAQEKAAMKAIMGFDLSNWPEK